MTTPTEPASPVARLAWQLAGATFCLIWVATVVTFPWVKGEWAGYAPVLLGALLAGAVMVPRVRGFLNDLVQRPRARRFLPCVLAGAMLLRLASIPYFPIEPKQDPGFYHQNAQRLVAGEPYGDPGRRAHYPPGMSLMLAGLYLVTGPSVLAAKVLGAALGVLMVFLIHDLAKLALSRRIARWAAVLAAVMPTLVFFSIALAYETLLGCLLLAACDLTIRSARRRGAGGWVLAAAVGAVLGFGALVKPICLLVPGICWLGWLTMGARWRSLRYLAVCLVLMAAVIAPWTMHNWRVFGGRFVLISTNGGEVLWAANNPRARGGYMPHQPLPGETDEISRDRLGKQAAMRWIRENPAAFARLAVRKAVYTWGTSSTVVSVLSADRMPVWRERAAQAAVNVFWAMLAGLALVACFRTEVWPARALWPAHLLLGYVFALHLVAEYHSRHHIPVLATLLILPAALLARETKPATPDAAVADA